MDSRPRLVRGFSLWPLVDHPLTSKNCAETNDRRTRQDHARRQRQCRHHAPEGTTTIALRLPRSQAQRIQQAAKQAGLTTSEYLRQLIKAGAES